MIQELDHQNICKIEPNFIYNRFDLFCDNYIVLMSKHKDEEQVFEARIFDHYVELGIWKMRFSNESLKEISDYLFLHYSKIEYVKFFFCDTDGEFKKVKHFSICIKLVT